MIQKKNKNNQNIREYVREYHSFTNKKAQNNAVIGEKIHLKYSQNKVHKTWFMIFPRVESVSEKNQIAAKSKKIPEKIMFLVGFEYDFEDVFFVFFFATSQKLKLNSKLLYNLFFILQTKK